MLRPLRVRLTLLYFLAGILLIMIVGGTTYGVLFFYFQNSTDLALRTKMASVFQSLGSPSPPSLVHAEEQWLQRKYSPFLAHNEEDGGLEVDEESEELSGSLIDYEGELSSIFILPVDAHGNLIFNPNPYNPPMRPDPNAIEKALVNGSDLRTVTLHDGIHVRLLTYHLTGQAGLDLIQLGKPIEDQLRILSQFLSGLLTIGSVVIILLGFGSWWQAGRILDSAQQAWDNQQMFIANASHELRAPLTLIRAASDAALRKTRKQSAVDSLLKDIISESDHMSHLVEDLLLLSRLDVGQLKLGLEPINLKGFVEDLQRHFQPLCNQRGVELVVDVRDVTINGDRTRLHQVMLILLDNALRHTDKGGQIHLEIGSIRRHASITVTDTGEGISPENLEHVFDRFNQVESDRRERASGSGLGLSIAKSIVEAHGGTIGIQSEEGKCTAVRILLPMEKKL